MLWNMEAIPEVNKAQKPCAYYKVDKMMNSLQLSTEF
jgi:hypothetical protein